MTYFRYLSDPVYECPSFWRYHHFFTAIVPLVAGFWFVFELSHWAWVFFGAFLVLAADDVVQHWWQAKQFKEYKWYDMVSFFHWFPNVVFGTKEKYV